MNRLKALLVEDEALIAYDLEDLLRTAGFDVVGPFATLANARERVLHEMPDLAIVDMLLRDDSAIPLIEMLHERNVPLVIVSGMEPPDDNRFAEAPWLTKPILPDGFLHAIDQVMSHNRASGPKQVS